MASVLVVVKVFGLYSVLILCSRDASQKLNPDLEHFRQAVKPQLQRILKRNTLSLGDACDVHHELMRKSTERRLLYELTMLFLKPKNRADITKKMQETVDETDAIDGPFCNTYKHLECTTNLICECSKEAEKILLGFKGHYEHEDGVCVLSKGSMCAPTEVAAGSTRHSMFDSFPLPDFTCAKNTNCVIKDTGEMCTTRAYVLAFERRVQMSKASPADVSFRVAVAHEGICVCKGPAHKLSIFVLGISIVVKYLFN